MKTRTPVLLGYDLAIAKARELHKKRTGHEYGALMWLAGQIGTSRQTLDNWSRRTGFPPKYVSKVAKALGMKPETIRPETIIMEMPTSIGDYVSMILKRDMLEGQVTVIPQRKR